MKTKKTPFKQIKIKSFNPNKRKIKNYHFFLNKKTIKLLQRIAKKQDISVSKLIRNIIHIMYPFLLNKEFSDSPRRSKRKSRIINKQELRVGIYQEDYDLFLEISYILNIPSIAEVLRIALTEYFRELSFDGPTEYLNKINKINIRYYRKLEITNRNHIIIHKNSYAKCLKQRIQVSVAKMNQVVDVLLM